MNDLLWRLTGGAPTDVEFKERLGRASDVEVRHLAVEYLDVRYAFLKALWNNELRAGASEDVLEDLADWLILRGPAALESVVRGVPDLPPRETWGELEAASLFHELFMEVKRRFNVSIYSMTGHKYPYPWTAIGRS